MNGLVERLARFGKVQGAGFDEVTGTLDVDGVSCLYVMGIPRQLSGSHRVVISHSFFEMYMLQGAEMELLRSLAAVGVPAIYVEAPGQGDSEGTPEDCFCAQRVAAAKAALIHLTAEAGNGTPCFFGARVGGLVSIRAAQTLDRPASVCVWDPVLDGHAYWKRVARLERIAATVGRRVGFQNPQKQLEAAGFATLLGVQTTPAQLADLEETARFVGGGGKLAGGAFAVALNDASAGPMRSTLSPLVEDRLEVLTLGLRDPWQLGLRSAGDAHEPSVTWMKETAP